MRASDPPAKPASCGLFLARPGRLRLGILLESGQFHPEALVFIIQARKLACAFAQGHPQPFVLSFKPDGFGFGFVLVAGLGYALKLG